MTTWDLNDTEFSQKAQLALYGVARQLAAENRADLPKRDIVRQRSSNYFIVNTESEINAQRLEYLMQQELQRLRLDIDFEYAIFDCFSNEMAYGGYCPAETPLPAGDAVSSSYLPPDEGLLYYFGVKFPTRTGYIWRKMQLVVFLSAILLVTVALFRVFVARDPATAAAGGDAEGFYRQHDPRVQDAAFYDPYCGRGVRARAPGSGRCPTVALRPVDPRAVRAPQRAGREGATDSGDRAGQLPDQA